MKHTIKKKLSTDIANDLKKEKKNEMDKKNI